MDVTQINILEVLAIGYALTKGYKYTFVLAVFVHVLIFTAIIQVLLSFLNPGQDYYAHIAFYFYLSVTGFVSALVFASIKGIHSATLAIAMSLQSILCLLVAFSGVDTGPFTFPGFDFAFKVAHFFNASIVTLEVLLTFHYLGGKRKSYN